MLYEMAVEKNTLRTSDHRSGRLCVMVSNVFRFLHLHTLNTVGVTFCAFSPAK